MKNDFGISLINLKKTPEAEYDIYIGRANVYRGLSASKWGNPFFMKNESDRPRVLADYRNYILNNKELYNSLEEIRGKKLACWCYDPSNAKKVCHGTVLIELLEKREKEKGLIKIKNAFYERYYIIKKFLRKRIFRRSV